MVEVEDGTGGQRKQAGRRGYYTAPRRLGLCLGQNKILAWRSGCHRLQSGRAIGWEGEKHYFWPLLSRVASRRAGWRRRLSPRMLSTSSFASRRPQLLALPRTGDASTGFTVAPEAELPFAVARAYWTYLAPNHAERGHHAHHSGEQLLVAVHGHLEIELENPVGERHHFALSQPDQGLYVPGLYWRTIRFHAPAVLLCLASEPYSEASYLRNYAAFRALGAVRPAP